MILTIKGQTYEKYQIIHKIRAFYYYYIVFFIFALQLRMLSRKTLNFPKSPNRFTKNNLGERKNFPLFARNFNNTRHD